MPDLIFAFLGMGYLFFVVLFSWWVIDTHTFNGAGPKERPFIVGGDYDVQVKDD